MLGKETCELLALSLSRWSVSLHRVIVSQTLLTILAPLSAFAARKASTNVAVSLKLAPIGQQIDNSDISEEIRRDERPKEVAERPKKRQRTHETTRPLNATSLAYHANSTGELAHAEEINENFMHPDAAAQSLEVNSSSDSQQDMQVFCYLISLYDD